MANPEMMTRFIGRGASKALTIKPIGKGASDSIITKLSAANKLLVEAKTIQQAHTVVALARAAEVFAQQRKLGEEAIGHAHSIKVYALRKLGEMLKAMPLQSGARGKRGGGTRGSKKELQVDAPATLAALGIDKKISALAQKIADLPEEKVVALAAKVETINGAHVGHNSGDNEWYTPAEIIEAVREVMGGIDLDPATSNEAQAVIKATRCFTPDDNLSLTSQWTGRIWLNPPYARPLISRFIDKLIAEEGVSQAAVLVNNATETEWGQKLLLWCDVACFPKGRIKFWRPRKASAPLQGQMICYRGERADRFGEVFAKYGVVLLHN